MKILIMTEELYWNQYIDENNVTKLIVINDKAQIIDPKFNLLEECEFYYTDEGDVCQEVKSIAKKYNLDYEDLEFVNEIEDLKYILFMDFSIDFMMDGLHLCNSENSENFNNFKNGLPTYLNKL